MKLTEKEHIALKKVAKFENSHLDVRESLGWTWQDVGAYPATINALIVKGLVRLSFKSNSSKNYLLTTEGIELSEHLDEYEEQEGAPEPEIHIPEDIFSDVIGHEDVKELLVNILQLSKPVHVLMYGPPSIAKTLFLWDIERVGRENAVWLLGSGTSKSGLWDLVHERRPHWLLIDELEKMNHIDMSGLLSLMEGGRLVRAKVGRGMETQVDTRVIAAANRVDSLPPELISRFAIRKLSQYSPAEFVTVVKGVLTHHEDTDPEKAEHIANELVGLTNDIRDAVRVARLSTKVDIKKAISLLLQV